MRETTTRDIREWVELYEAGWSTHDIALAYSTTSPRISRWLKRKGVDVIAPQIRRRAERQRVVERLTNAGWSAADIAQHIGITKRQVFRHRARLRAAKGGAEESR